MDVNLYFPAEVLSQTSALRKRVAQVCEVRGWNFQPRSLHTKRAADGRPVPLVALDVAKGLYPRVHRSRVATLVVGGDARVPLHASEDEAQKLGRHVRLRRFVKYKSCWIRVPNDPRNDSWVGSFASWCERIECDSDHDPRCLPFHVFSGAGAGLQSADRRRAFDDRYGSGADRVDDRGSRWVLNPHEYHGRESLRVAGYELRSGCHWDVSAEDFRFYTPFGMWWGSGHVNIYPD